MSVLDTKPFDQYSWEVPCHITHSLIGQHVEGVVEGTGDTVDCSLSVRFIHPDTKVLDIWALSPDVIVTDTPPVGESEDEER